MFAAGQVVKTEAISSFGDLCDLVDLSRRLPIERVLGCWIRTGVTIPRCIGRL